MRRLENHADPMDWIAPQVVRTDPPEVADERNMLDGWLDFHRETLLMKCAGLTAEQLRRRAVEPSNLSLLGLIRHMAEVERSWFQRRVARRDIAFLFCDVTANPDGDFDAESHDPIPMVNDYRPRAGSLALPPTVGSALGRPSLRPWI